MLVTLAFAGVSYATWWFLQDTWLRVNALLWAFIYSMATANLYPPLARGVFISGISFVSGGVLRLAVALLGLTISASLWMKLGWIGVMVVLLNLGIAFLFGSLFCRYGLKMGGRLSVLVGVGTGICGASAIAATGPAIKAKEEEMGVALAAITLFGLLAMFAFPLLFNNGLVNLWLGREPLNYGIWVGMGVHEMAQVIAAASQVDGAVGVAMAAKSIRIFMLGPMVLASLLLVRRFGRETGEAKGFPVPWFAFAFVAFTLVNTGLAALPIGEGWASVNQDLIKPGVTFLLAWAFVGVGFKVRASAVLTIGPKAFLGGVVVALAASLSALLLTRFLWLPLHGS